MAILKKNETFTPPSFFFGILQNWIVQQSFTDYLNGLDDVGRFFFVDG